MGGTADIDRSPAPIASEAYDPKRREAGSKSRSAATPNLIVTIPLCWPHWGQRTADAIRSVETSPVHYPARGRGGGVAARGAGAAGAQARSDRLPAGGKDVSKELAGQKSAKDRIVSPEAVIAAAPDIILASWCGKKVVPEKIRPRPGWSKIPAVQTNRIIEIKSPLILQPGPAALSDGLDAILSALGRES
jgi:ABC-type hemin transport system substrate-binding protein